MWAGQGAQEVQVDGAEGSDRPVGAAAEDELVCDGQAGGLGRLQTDRWTDMGAGPQRNETLTKRRNYSDKM